MRRSAGWLPSAARGERVEVEGFAVVLLIWMQVLAEAQRELVDGLVDFLADLEHVVGEVEDVELESRGPLRPGGRACRARTRRLGRASATSRGRGGCRGATSSDAVVALELERQGAGKLEVDVVRQRAAGRDVDGVAREEAGGLAERCCATDCS